MAAWGVEGIVLESTQEDQTDILDSILQQMELYSEAPVSVLGVPPHPSGSIYLLSQEPCFFTSKFCSRKGYAAHLPWGVRKQ